MLVVGGVHGLCTFKRLKIFKITRESGSHLSHEKNPPTFHYTGCLIGILILAYYNPYITGYYNPLYNPTNQGFFHGSSCFGEIHDEWRMSYVFWTSPSHQNTATTTTSIPKTPPILPNTTTISKCAWSI